MKREPRALHSRRCASCGGELSADCRHLHGGAAAPGRSVDEFASIRLAADLESDEVFQQEFMLLQNLARFHVREGVRLNDLLPGPITHPLLREWQKDSNSLCRDLAGRHDLRRKRRWDLLRSRSGVEKGFPLAIPLEFSVFDPPADERTEWRIFRLQDELEYRGIRFRRANDPAVPWRPVQDILAHADVRAILDWKASHLDLWLSTRADFIGGYISLGFTEDARQSLDALAESKDRALSKPRDKVHKVRFDTLAFMTWFYANMN